MRYEKILNKIKKEMAEEPIFIDEIYKILNDYSKQGVYNFINEALSKGDLKKEDRGVYNSKDNNVVTSEEIAEKKYVRSNGKIFGIYGLLYMEVNFGISTQIPNSIDIISNNATRKYRELKIKNRKIILRKSRCEINNSNYCEYMLLELFNNYDINKLDEYVRDHVIDFVKKNKIQSKKMIELSNYFPGKAIKNLYSSGVSYAFI